MTPILAKRVIKRAAGLASVVLRPVAPTPPQPAACILMYHRMTSHGAFDPWLDDWNVAPRSFERHVAALAETSEFLFVRELTARLARPESISKPLVCLTFDDGFRNFHDEALPVLRRYGAKATVFVVTGYVGTDRPMPFDRWGVRHHARTRPDAWLPLGWSEIEACARSGVVELGSHSHRHANGSHCSADEVRDEAERSREVLRRRLGDDHATSYAYPYGSTRLGHVTPAYIDAVRASGYAAAVSTNMGLAHAGSPRHALPRIEICQSDGAAVVRAKAAGSLLPYTLTDRLRRAKR